MDSAQGCDLAPIFADLSQSEKLSEIEPPLAMNTIPAKVEIESKTNFNPKIETDLKKRALTGLIKEWR